MGYGAYRHSRRKIKKAHYKSKLFTIAVSVKREPVYARGKVYGVKVRLEPAYVATVCTGGSNKRCSVAKGHGPTAAVRAALTQFAKKVR